MVKVEYIVSEWGFQTEFNSFTDAISHCVDNKLLNGDEGLLWIHCTCPNELMIFINSFYAEHEYMRFKWEDEPNNWIWNSVDKIWEDCTEIEDEGEEDFEEYFEDRKKYIEIKYGN